MNIDELFKNKLQNSEMPVSNNVWDKINSRINTVNTPDTAAQSQTGKLSGAIKSMSLAAKTVIGAVGLAGVITTGVLLYNNFSASENENSVTANNNINTRINENNTANNDNQLNNNNAEQTLYLYDTVLKNNEFRNDKDKIRNIDFEIEQDSEGNITNEPNVGFTDVITLQEPDPVILKAVQTAERTAGEPPYDTMRIKENYQIRIQIPNVVTPNGDGVNDCFVIRNIENYRDNTLIVFNRNGKIVYQQENYNNGFCPENLQEGTYFYKLTVKINNYKKEFTGAITVMY